MQINPQGGRMNIKKRKNPVLFCLLVFLLSAIPVIGTPFPALQESEPAEENSLEALDALMENRSVKNSEAAIKGYEKLLKKNPDNPELLVKIANAYITIIDIKTSALIEEKDEYKPILDKLGKISYDYATRACKMNPRSKEAVGACLVAYGYYSAGFGIIKAILKGAAGRYKDLANELIQIDDKYDGALGYRSLGKLYEVAPWPVGSSRKALIYFKKAVEADHDMLYSHYYLGVLYFKKDEYDRAKVEFKFVVEKPPHASEAYFIKAYKDEARKYLEKIALEQK
jgi:tetratricopeptide (TPR) repeat protein